MKVCQVVERNLWCLKIARSSASILGYKFESIVTNWPKRTSWHYSLPSWGQEKSQGVTGTRCRLDPRRIEPLHHPWPTSPWSGRQRKVRQRFDKDPAPRSKHELLVCIIPRPAVFTCTRWHQQNIAKHGGGEREVWSWEQISIQGQGSYLEVLALWPVVGWGERVHQWLWPFIHFFLIASCLEPILVQFRCGACVCVVSFLSRQCSSPSLITLPPSTCLPAVAAAPYSGRPMTVCHLCTEERRPGFSSPCFIPFLQAGCIEKVSLSHKHIYNSVWVSDKIVLKFFRIFIYCVGSVHLSNLSEIIEKVGKIHV